MSTFHIVRADGRYFTGPAQLEWYSWSPHLEHAKPFYSRKEAERICEDRPEIDGIRVIDAVTPKPE